MDKGTPFTEFVNKMNGKPLSEGLIGVEVGVRDGQNALFLLKHLNIKKLYLVDSFLPYQDVDRFYTAEEQEEEYRKLILTLDEYSDKTIIITKTSKRAREVLSFKSFDFVYIDANHGYKSVKDDLKWWDLIAFDGVIGGHDYNTAFCPDIKKAVDEFALKVKLSVWELEGSSRGAPEWAIHKTTLKDAKSYISNNSS